MTRIQATAFRVRRAAAGWCVIAWLLVFFPGPLAATEPLFERDVRPILKAHCFHCHGEADHREGQLDVRLRRLLVAGGESGPAIEPGNLTASYLLDRVRAGEMPPSDKKLSPGEIDVLERWVAGGAATARPEPESLADLELFTEEERAYWAFQPITRPALPSLPDGAPVQSPIDAFLLARLQAEGQQFSPEADRVTLVRRLYIDLLGVPPTPDEVAAHLADTRPDAWERLVDRLLSSPHYGERWGRHWLDTAGYADSEGYTDEDRPRANAFRYRDYVIDALNADRPWDRFVTEQLAGDELVAPPFLNLTAEQRSLLAATGFLRMAPDGTGSGGVNKVEGANQVVADTLAIVSSSLMGLTVRCAQCHDHRYDPIPQADYYRLRAIFEPALNWKAWKTPAQREVSMYTDVERAAAKQIDDEAAAVDAERTRKSEEYITRTLEEELLEAPEEIREALRTAFRTESKQRTEEQQTLLGQYPRVGNISAGSLYLYDERREVKARQLDTQRTQREKELIAAAEERTWAEVAEADRDGLRAALAVAADQRSPEQQALCQKYPELPVTADSLARLDPAAAEELAGLKAKAQELRTTKATDDLKRYTEKAAEIRARRPPEGFIRALSEPTEPATPTFVFHRGDPEQPRETVEPGDLRVLPDAATFAADDAELPTSGRRLAFARHLTSGRHPLLARVLVNRFWMHHFGRGIVATTEDFGQLGTLPTHPELLDWLADDFMRHGWQLKRLHRLIVTSTAYRQSSRRRPELDEIDPDNLLLGRMNLRRMEAEVVRDAMLVAAGRWNTKMAGEPVPVMEDDVGRIVLGRENLDGERKPVQAISLHGDEFRRSVYVQVRRSRILGMLETFDAASLDPNCARRNASAVPTQALMLMNSPETLDAATGMADRLAREAGSELSDQIELAWRIAYGRSIPADQLAFTVNWVDRQRETLRAQFDKEEEASIARRALTSLCHALLSSSEFLYID